jgi:hypothetical protein
MKCGHPSDWVLRLRQNGRTYTYCMGCIVEKLQLDNLEIYPNPYVKGMEKTKPVEKKPKAKKTKE